MKTTAPNRLAFLLDGSLRTFCYGSPASPHARGNGLAVERYNPLTDQVHIRRSHLGCVTRTEQISRLEYWAERMDFAPEDRKQ